MFLTKLCELNNTDIQSFADKYNYSAYAINLWDQGWRSYDSGAFFNAVINEFHLDPFKFKKFCIDRSVVLTDLDKTKEYDEQNFSSLIGNDNE